MTKKKLKAVIESLKAEEAQRRKFEESARQRDIAAAKRVNMAKAKDIVHGIPKLVKQALLDGNTAVRLYQNPEVPDAVPSGVLDDVTSCIVRLLIEEDLDDQLRIDIDMSGNYKENSLYLLIG